MSSYFRKKRRKLSRSILSEEQNYALESLRKDRDTVISKPDKGNGVVIFNCNDYVDKMHEILDNRTKFMPCNQDTNLSNFTRFQRSELLTSNLTRFQRSLCCLNSKKALCSKIYSRIYPTSTTTSSLYGFPKPHKPRIPLRPILSSGGSFNHECARWLSQSLENLNQHPIDIPDTFTFLSKIFNHNLANQTTVSFDQKPFYQYSSLIYLEPHTRIHLC